MRAFAGTVVVVVLGLATSWLLLVAETVRRQDRAAVGMFRE